MSTKSTSNLGKLIDSFTTNLKSENENIPCTNLINANEDRTSNDSFGCKVRAILRVRPILQGELEREQKAFKAMEDSGQKATAAAVFMRHSQYRKLLLSSSSSSNSVQEDHANVGIIGLQGDLPPMSLKGEQVIPMAVIPNPRNPCNESINYNFDAIFNANATQDLIFKDQIEPLLPPLFRGLSTTVFAYGPTSAGKTFTMLGNNQKPGIIPQTLRYLCKVMENPNLQGIKKVDIKFSLLEIYNEKVFDLLSSRKDEISIRENFNHSISLPNLTEIKLISLSQFQQIYEQGLKAISKGSTKLNSDSSRSHTILRVLLESEKLVATGVQSFAKLHLIDLAGSEDNRRTENTGVRLKESGAINRSLFVLGQVVEAINNKSHRIPYRDSKLTRILQDCLGGKAQALIITNVAPTWEFLYETYRTLNFASRSRKIQNQIEFVEFHKKDDLTNNEKKNKTKRWSTGVSEVDATNSINDNNNKKSISSRNNDIIEKRNSLPTLLPTTTTTTSSSIKGKKRQRKNIIIESSDSEYEAESSDEEYFADENSFTKDNVKDLVNEAVKKQVDEKFSSWIHEKNQKNVKVVSDVASMLTPGTRSRTAQAYLQQSRKACRLGNLEEAEMLKRHAMIFSSNQHNNSSDTPQVVTASIADVTDLNTNPTTNNQEKKLAKIAKQQESQAIYDSISESEKSNLSTKILQIIQTGSLRVIQSLKGIGAKRAEAIVNCRLLCQPLTPETTNLPSDESLVDPLKELCLLLEKSGLASKLVHQIVTDNIIDLFLEAKK